MTQAIFEECLRFTLPWEGGYSDNPDDAGGPTSRGITQATYDVYRTRRCLPLRSVQLAPLAEVKDAYQLLFWVPSYAYLFDFPLALALFDTAVQFNPETNMRFKRAALGLPLEASSAKMLEELKTCNQVAAACKIADMRYAFRAVRVKQDPSQKGFLAGWQNRDIALKRLILHPPAALSDPTDLTEPEKLELGELKQEVLTRQIDFVIGLPTHPDLPPIDETPLPRKRKKKNAEPQSD